MSRVFLFFFCGLIALAQSIPLSEFAKRREDLRKALPDSVVVVWSTASPPDTGDRNGTFQDPNFYYLTGWRQHDAILILCAACPEEDKEILFLPKRNPRKEIFDGPQTAPGDANAPSVTGFAKVFPAAKFESEVRRALESAQNLHTVFDGDHEDTLRKIAPLRKVNDARLPIARLRVTKSEAELAVLNKSIAASIEAHLASWKAAKPGKYEYEVSAAMQAVYLSRGCERSSYAPIVGSGPNSVILHYNANKRQMDGGEVLLMDVAAECSAYAADITRTVPVNGKWTPRQKEIYNMVLAAQDAVIAAAKPGMLLSELTKIARAYLKNLGNGPNGKTWDTYLTHGVSHHIGLDVHDPFDPALPLTEGAVITVEPGLYVTEEKIGVRIEDMILITKDGAKLLTRELPRNADEIERRMSR